MLDPIEAAAARRRLARRGVSPDARPQPTMRTGSDCLPQIQHIVILMMENHSYDNYLGLMAGRGDGLPLDDHGMPSPTNAAGDGTVVRMRHFASTQQKHEVPTQSWNASHIQCDGGTCAGFVRSIEQTLPGRDASVAMTYWDQEDLPFYYAWRGPSRWRRGGSLPAWARRSPTGGSSSPAQRTGSSMICHSAWRTTRPRARYSTCWALMVSAGRPTITFLLSVSIGDGCHMLGD